MTYPTRKEQFEQLFPEAPPFRWKQIECALFDPTIDGWSKVTTLPKNMREQISQIPWISCTSTTILESKLHDTYKAALAGYDGKLFESVLMANARGSWTICVSSQIGCAMRCTFCATGTMGLKRSLTSDEITDQYRYWNSFLREKNIEGRISNVVFMGMGEPLANYENIKTAIRTWLDYTDLGPTRITVSSVGVIPQLEKILTDKTWPNVRIAISLHSANPEKRKEIVPSTIPDFLPKLADWARRYEATLGNRRHQITFEYTLLNTVNDTPEHARELATFVKSTGAHHINVIPYNPVAGKTFARSQQDRIDAFKKIVSSHGLDITQRRTMGDDISAACGQLVTTPPLIFHNF